MRSELEASLQKTTELGATRLVEACESAISKGSNTCLQHLDWYLPWHLQSKQVAA